MVPERLPCLPRRIGPLIRQTLLSRKLIEIVEKTGCCLLPGRFARRRGCLLRHLLQCNQQLILEFLLRRLVIETLLIIRKVRLDAYQLLVDGHIRHPFRIHVRLPLTPANFHRILVTFLLLLVPCCHQSFIDLLTVPHIRIDRIANRGYQHRTPDTHLCPDWILARFVGPLLEIKVDRHTLTRTLVFTHKFTHKNR